MAQRFLRQKLLFTIAWRHLTTLRRTSFSTLAGTLSIAGLSIGLAALIITYSIIDGFEGLLSEKIARFDGHIEIEHFFDLPITGQMDSIDSLLAPYQDQLIAVPYTEKPFILRKGSRAEGALCLALEHGLVPPGLVSTLDVPTTRLKAGEILLGDRLAHQLGARAGDSVVMMDLSPSPEEPEPYFHPVRVAGTIHSGLLDYDQTILLTSTRELAAFSESKPEITGVKIFERDPRIHARLLRDLNHRLSYPLTALSWKDKHRILYEWMSLQRWPILIIFGLIALVGIVNITAAIMMIILEKTRQIGILRAQGFRGRQIQSIFLYESGLIGLLGGGLGFVLAAAVVGLQSRWSILSIPEDVYFMDHIPVHWNWPMTLALFLGTWVITLMISWWPVRRSQAIHPAEALRYE
ncbi:MAG: ABC transporter permease [Candidatus Neomarinimicrobiota bacterium]|nr:MAG: ABC transporter permease [Candidatus Neomarinimicrobiota bacterium]